MTNDRDDDLSSGATVLSSSNQISISEEIEDARKERDHRRWFRLISFAFGWVLVGIAYCQAYGFVDRLAASLTAPDLVVSSSANSKQIVPSGAAVVDKAVAKPKPTPSTGQTTTGPTKRHLFTDLTPLLVTTLVLLFLLPTSIAVALLRFSFNGNSEASDEKAPPSITTPTLETVKELLTELKEWLKR